LSRISDNLKVGDKIYFSRVNFNGRPTSIVTTQRLIEKIFLILKIRDGLVWIDRENGYYAHRFDTGEIRLLKNLPNYLKLK